MKKHLLTLLALTASYQSDALTLTESMVHTYNYNSELNSKREELKAYDEQLFDAMSGFLPDVTFVSSSSSQKLENSPLPRSKSSRSENKIVLRQQIFNGGSSLAALEKAKFDIQARRADVNLTESFILAKAAKAYSEVIFYKHALEASETNVKDHEKQLSATQDKYEAGIATKTNVALAEQGLASSQTSLIKAQGDYANAIANFKKEIGLDPENLMPITEQLELPKTLEQAFEISKKNSFELEAAKNQYESAEIDVKSALSVMLPNLSLNAEKGGSIDKNYRTNTDPNFGKRNDYNAITMQLNVPIYQRGKEYSNIRKAKAVAASSKSKLMNANKSIREQVTNAWTNYQTAKATLISSSKNLSSAQVALDGAQQEYDEGLLSITDLLNTRAKFFNAKIEKFAAEKNLIITAFNLQYRIGMLTAQNLNLPTKFYDLNENYNNTKFKLIGF